MPVDQIHSAAAKSMELPATTGTAAGHRVEAVVGAVSSRFLEPQTPADNPDEAEVYRRYLGSAAGVGVSIAQPSESGRVGGRRDRDV